MIEHIYQAKVITGDNISENDFRDIVAEELGFIPNAGVTKMQYIKKHLSNILLKLYEKGLDKKEDIVKKEKVATQLQGTNIE